MANSTVKHQWDDERRRICLEGAWELDKIARILPDLVPLDDDQNHYAVKAMAGRMLRLTNMLMDAFNQDESNDKIKKAVCFDLGQG